MLEGGSHSGGKTLWTAFAESDLSEVGGGVTVIPDSGWSEGGGGVSSPVSRLELSKGGEGGPVSVGGGL